MKKIFISLITLSSFGYAVETNNIKEISKTLGHLVAENLEKQPIKIDIAEFIKGMEEKRKGKTPPMTEQECLMALSKHQEKAIEDLCKKNLAQAEKFLTENKKTKDMKSLAEGKLLYKVLKEGKGAKVELHHAPLVRYQAKYLDGTVFDKTKEGAVIPLNEAFVGLQKGLVGMKEGEQRILYIHPELAYGKRGPLLPNALLIFEVELIEVNPSTVPSPLTTFHTK